MIGQTISHYKILEKLGEVPKLPTPACRNNCNSLKPITALRRVGTSVSQRVDENLSLPAEHASRWQAGIPTLSVGSWARRFL